MNKKAQAVYDELFPRPIELYNEIHPNLVELYYEIHPERNPHPKGTTYYTNGHIWLAVDY